MGKKTQRLALVSELITAGEFSSHEELLARLREAGVQVTQSTLSRDIKELGAVKVDHHDKGYVYMMPGSINGSVRESGPSLVTDNIVGLDFSGNIAVIRTLPGYANAVASVIDKDAHPFAVGTVAGNDTIFMLLTESADHESVRRRLAADYPKISSLFV